MEDNEWLLNSNQNRHVRTGHYQPWYRIWVCSASYKDRVSEGSQLLTGALK